jgi:hypothetical protein
MRETYADRYIALAKKRYLNGRLDEKGLEAEIARIMANPGMRVEIPQAAQVK